MGDPAMVAPSRHSTVTRASPGARKDGEAFAAAVADEQDDDDHGGDDHPAGATRCLAELEPRVFGRAED